jgi:sugar transferase (PEP-CTERM system associated)
MVRIFGHFVPVAMVALGISEALVIAFALHFGISIAGAADPMFQVFGGTIIFPIVAAIIIVLMMDLTKLYNVDVVVDVRRALRNGTPILICVIALAILLSVQAPGVSLIRVSSPWKAILLLPTAWLLSVIFTRTIFSRISRTGILRRRVLIVGQGQRVIDLRELSKAGLGANFLPVAQVGTQPYGHPETDGQLLLKERVDTVDLLTLARTANAAEIVIAVEDRRGIPVNQLLQCRLAGINVLDYIDFYERESGRVDLNALRPSWFIFSRGFGVGPMGEIAKRGFDIVGSVSLLVVLFPLMMLTALAIYLESGGPVLYRQERVGHKGNFMLYKFRSMTVDAEENGSPVWAAKEDPRVTRVGWLIRKLRIDELPQLYNVLRGEMSVVGPRPERPYFVSRLAKSIPYYLERHAVKPGITGWAQVNYPYGASLEDAREKLSYDLYYLKNRGIFLDIIILVRTLRVILWPDGAR